MHKLTFVSPRLRVSPQDATTVERLARLLAQD